MSDLTWTLSGDDAGHFSIDNPVGVLRFDFEPVAPNLFAAAADFEAPVDVNGDNAYEVTVRVSSGMATQSLDVTVTVEDQDEAGTLALAATRPRLGSELTATLSDPDDVDGTPVYTWERSAGRNAWTVIAGATTESYTPASADADRFLRVTATYADHGGAGKTLSERLFASQLAADGGRAHRWLVSRLFHTAWARASTSSSTGSRRGSRMSSASRN